MDENKRDAQRYRWLRNNGHLNSWWSAQGPEDRNSNIDADIDTAMDIEALSVFTLQDELDQVVDFLSEMERSVTESLIAFLNTVSSKNKSGAVHLILKPFKDCEDGSEHIFVEARLERKYYAFLDERDMIDDIVSLYLDVRDGKFERNNVSEFAGKFPIMIVVED